MNRDIDYRADFYSLGIIFYEMLIGWRPFQTEDALEMIHAHIAKQATPPHELNSAIPAAISAVIMKMIAKNAEDRYQSALGLKADLKYCLDKFLSSEKVELFQLGKREVLDQFQIPQKLYGREEQVKNLLEAFDEVSAGSNKLVLIKGPSGTGKSVLVNEIQKSVLKQRGYFISGKFEEFRRNIPYGSLLQAFQELIRQLLTESTANLEMWESRIKDALGPNAQVVVDVIPEVEWIIGKQKQVPLPAA